MPWTVPLHSVLLLTTWSVILGTWTVVLVQRIRLRKLRRTTMPLAACSGKISAACRCDGSCQHGAAWCQCPVCTTFPGGAGGGLIAGALTSKQPAPRGGGGLQGFAEQGQQEFDFAVGSVRGLRQWTLDGPDFRADPHQADQNWAIAALKGATGYLWANGVLEGECRNNASHEVPTENDPVTNSRCGCGFWAYWDMSGLGANGSAVSGNFPVLGIIEGHGRVLLGTRGFRSQRAQIVALAPAFSIQTEVDWQSSWRQRDPYDRHRNYGLNDPYLNFSVSHRNETEKEEKREEVTRRAQQHADAWMAVIQDRLGQMYPAARVYATVNGLLASERTEGRP